jgi:hypothetical protein
VPTSGTSERSNITRWLTGAVPAGAIGYTAGTGDFVTPLLAGGAAVGIPKLIAQIYGTEAATRFLASSPERQKIIEQGLVQSLLGAGSQYGREKSQRVPVADPVPPSRILGSQQ